MRARGLLVLALLALPSAAAAPEQVHLGLPGSDPSAAMSVLWVDTAPLPDTTLRLTGPDGSRDIHGARVAGPSVGAVFEAPLALQPDAAYHYTLGGRAFDLRTPPVAMGPGGFTFVALGDMGTTDRSRGAERAVAQLDPAFVLHAGDVSYAQGDPLAWKAWFDLVEPVAASRPWIPALGNHETYTGPAPVPADLGPASEIALFRQRFGLPGNELWYSFDWAGVHIVALDTFSRDAANRDAPVAPEELAWLDRDLADHAAAPWTIAFLHEPAYSSNRHGSSARVQQALVPLFERHRVDLVIQAHDHAYERTLPLLGGEPVARDANATVAKGSGVVYVTSGGGGESLYRQWAQPAPAWSAARRDLYHVLAVHVTPDALEVRVVPTAGDAFADAVRIEQAGSTEGGALQNPLARPAPDLPLVGVFALGAIALLRRRAGGAP